MDQRFSFGGKLPSISILAPSGRNGSHGWVSIFAEVAIWGGINAKSPKTASAISGDRLLYLIVDDAHLYEDGVVNQNSKMLPDFYLLRGRNLFGCFLLWKVDCQHAMFDFGRDVVPVHIVRKHEALTE